MGSRKIFSGLVLIVALLFSAPVFAHEAHEKQAAARAQAAASATAVPAAAPESGMTVDPGTAQDMDHSAMMAEEARKPMPQRLYRWLGAMHPAAVHFPIALFLVAAIHVSVERPGRRLLRKWMAPQRADPAEARRSVHSDQGEPF